MLEAGFKSRADFERNLKKSGYSPVDWGCVTLNWGIKAGKEHASDPTQAIVIFRDEPEVAYNVGIGAEGSYTIEPALSPDMTARYVKESLLISRDRIGCAFSRSVKEFVQENWDIDIEAI